jgi:CRISPR-associated protein Cmr4
LYGIVFEDTEVKDNRIKIESWRYSMTELTKQKTHDLKIYYALTLDPVHVGTGGYRLGRVDNAIVREPGTNLPKIPGTSISGVARSNTAMQTGKFPRCAGKGKEEGEDVQQHCGEKNCPVCVAFGFSKKENSFQGLAQFFDARILFFPVYSMLGPVWVTSPSALADAGIKQGVSVSPEGFKAINREYNKPLNFGWLMLQKDASNSKEDVSFDSLVTCDVCGIIRDNAFIVSDKVFSRIVNDNLEVRTSVAIDPETGAAEDKALFTYEAIPRGTVMWFDVVYNDPKFFKIKGESIDASLTRDVIAARVFNGLQLMEHLGVGGMNTRGMGRFRVWEGRI